LWDVIALLDELSGETEPPVIVGQEVGPQARPDHRKVSLRMVKVGKRQVPERHRLVVARPFIVRRQPRAGAHDDADPIPGTDVDRLDRGAPSARRLGKSKAAAQQRTNQYDTRR
jgi:hypothetical protein